MNPNPKAPPLARTERGLIVPAHALGVAGDGAEGAEDASHDALELARAQRKQFEAMQKAIKLQTRAQLRETRASETRSARRDAAKRGRKARRASRGS